MKPWIAGVAAAALGVGAFGGAAGAQVFLRGQAVAVAGDVVKVGAEGASVKSGESTSIVGWDRVREVRGEHGAEAVRFADLSDHLWRARTRLERGDFAAAEGLLDALVDRSRGVAGPTSVVVFDGLVRCRMKRGAQVSAVWAWLDWARVRGAEPGRKWIGGRIEGAPVMDEETGLATALPPIFLRDAALDAAAASDEWERFAASEGDAGDLAMLYRAAAKFEAGSLAQLRPVSSKSEGVRLVGEVVGARVGDEAARAEARGALQRRLETKELEPWIECWCRVGLGRSLLRETDAEIRRQGVIQLLHAPARFVRVSPSLASIALAEAAVALHELDDQAGAEALKGELLDRFPRSAAAGWGSLRDIHIAGEAAPPPAAAGTPAGAKQETGAPAGVPGRAPKNGRLR